MKNRWSSREIAARLASVATVWAVTSALNTPRAKAATKKVDRKLNRSTMRAKQNLEKAGTNVRHSPGLMAAGAASLIAALALFGRAAAKR